MSVTKLSIDRSKWGTGTLLDGDTGKKCCLGHLGTACGIPDSVLRGHDMPNTMPRHWLAKYPVKFFKEAGEDDCGLASLAQHVNDSPCMGRPEKEYRLKILFRAHGIKLTFRGKP